MTWSWRSRTTGTVLRRAKTTAPGVSSSLVPRNGLWRQGHRGGAASELAHDGGPAEVTTPPTLLDLGKHDPRSARALAHRGSISTVGALAVATGDDGNVRPA